MSNSELDSLRLNFSEGNLLFLNLALALIMLGVALDLRWEDFKYLALNPKGFILGLLSQFFILPFLTFLLVLAIQPPPSVALGMILVAACPGGNVSNFLSAYAKGNTALSVSLTAVSTGLSVIFTPLNFALWAGLYGPGAHLLKEISLQITDVLHTTSVILGVPLLVGTLVRKYAPQLADKLSKVLRPLSIVIFGGFILIAFLGNLSVFMKLIGVIFLWVLAHNIIALSAGLITAKLGKLPLSDVKTITIETGIQNSGLGLVLIFTYFDGLGGMAIIAAWWGIWHLISGMAVATLWKNKT